MSSSSKAPIQVAVANALLVRDGYGQYRPASSEEVLQRARTVLAHRVRRGVAMHSPRAVKDFLRFNIGMLEHEVFAVLYLDAQHRLMPSRNCSAARSRRLPCTRGRSSRKRWP